MKVSLRLILAFILLVPVLASCTGDSPVTDLAICSSLPLNSGNNERAVSMRNAIDLAMSEQPSVTIGDRSYRLRHIALDDTSPETGSWDTVQETRNARAAITEHRCVAYIGTYNSGAAKIAIPILNRVQMPMISPGNTYPGLTKPGGGLGDEPWIYSPLGPDKRNFCRVVPADDLQAPAAARYAQATYGVTRVAILHDTQLYGRGLAELFAAEAEALGMTITQPPFGIDASRTTSSDTSYVQDLADRLMQDSPELVYFGGNASSGAGFIYAALLAKGYQGLFAGGDAMAESQFIRDTGLTQPTDRVFATLVSLPADQLTGRGTDFGRAYRSRYGEPDPFAAPSYEATQVLLAAMQRAQIPDGPNRTFVERARPAILAALRETRDYDGIMGRWSFDENCDTTLTTITINTAGFDDFQFVDVVE